MKYRILLMLLLFIGGRAFAQDAIKRNMYYGNMAYNEADYETAIDYFQSAVDQSPLNFKANYNLANTYHRMNKQDEAIERYEKVVNLAPTSLDKAKVYHNIGNAHMFKQDLDGAIDSYKEALRLNPSDAETRYNLAYAMQLKQKQQQEQKQNQNQNQNQSENGNESEDQNENGNENQNQNQNENENENENGNQDQNGDENENEEDQSQNSNGNEEQPNQDKKEGDGQSYSSKLSKEQIQNILDTYYKREKELQKKLDKDKRVGYGSPKKKDW
ncbi:MAG: tetratricopeptide repeat protein [Crocinitomicaceae bacterium]